MEYIIPAVVILIGNLFSGAPGSNNWQNVTALFGWGSCISLAAWFVVSFTSLASWGHEYLVPVFGFCLLQALTRDYERLLKPCFDRWFRIRKK